MPPRRASRGEAVARRAAEELVAATAAEPAPNGGASAGTPPRRRRVEEALAALHLSLPGAGAAAALSVDGLLVALLREAAAPPGPYATAAALSLLSLTDAAGGERGAPAGPAADALGAALRRDAESLFDALGRAGAYQAAARSAAGGGAAAPSSSDEQVAPGLQLFVLLRLADKHLKDGHGLEDGSLLKAFARARSDAVAAALEALLHGCAGFDNDGLARQTAALALALLTSTDLPGMRHLRGAFSRLVPALVERLGRGAPGSTPNERLCLARVLQARCWGRTLLLRHRGGDAAARG
jgi:hypothetical protein